MNVLSQVLCFLWAILSNPLNFVLWLVNVVIEILFSWLPRTPDNLKISYMLSQLLLAVPIGSGVLVEIVQGVAGILIIFLTFRMVKYLPFL